MPAITETWLESLGPIERDRVYFDNKLTGFGVRATTSGRKTFVLEYRLPGAKQNAPKRRIKLGQCGALSVKEARKQAGLLLADIIRGIDPIGQRVAKRSERTVAEFAAEYREVASADWRPRTAVEFNRYWDQWLLPALGSKSLKSVSDDDLKALHNRISARGHRTLANRVVAHFGTFWTWASKEPSPVAGFKYHRENKKERFLTQAELIRLGKALTDAETVGIPWAERKEWKAHTPNQAHRRTILTSNTVDSIRALIFTGCRLREILNLRWRDVDFDTGILWLPKTKTTPRAVVLSTVGIALIQRVWDRAVETLNLGEDDAEERKEPPLESAVFSDQPGGEPRHDLQRPWALVCRAAGLEGVRLHDLRHTFASVGVQRGLSLPAIGKLLGHATPQATARYAHHDFNSVRRAADLVAGEIAPALMPAKDVVHVG